MFANKNTIQINTPYYNFALRGSAYSHLSYVPQIFVSRVDANTIEIIVYINERNYKTKSFITRQIITYKEKLSNVEDYFRSVQNSNFKFALPNSVLFLEKVIKAIQTQFVPPSSLKLKSTTPPPVTGIPTTASSAPIYFSYNFTSPTTVTITAVNASNATSSSGAATGNFRVDPSQINITYLPNSYTEAIFELLVPASNIIFSYYDPILLTITNASILWDTKTIYPNASSISGFYMFFSWGQIVFTLQPVEVTTDPAATNYEISAVSIIGKTPADNPYESVAGPYPAPPPKAVILSQSYQTAVVNLNLCTTDGCIYQNYFSFAFTDGSTIGFTVQYCNSYYLPFVSYS
jgi:hypothetical protein